MVSMILFEVCEMNKVISPNARAVALRCYIIPDRCPVSIATHCPAPHKWHGIPLKRKLANNMMKED